MDSKQNTNHLREDEICLLALNLDMATKDNEIIEAFEDFEKDSIGEITLNIAKKIHIIELLLKIPDESCRVENLTKKIMENSETNDKGEAPIEMLTNYFGLICRQLILRNQSELASNRIMEFIAIKRPLNIE